MTDIVHMRNDVIESVTKGIQVKFEYKAEGGIVTKRTVTPAKFYSDFTGFTGYDTDKQEDRNFRFERVQKWKGLYGNEVEWEIEIFREGQRLESYSVIDKDEDKAREKFEAGDYDFNFSHEFSPDNSPKDSEIQSIEVME